MSKLVNCTAYEGGELNINFFENKIDLKRCCRGKPFYSCSIEEFLKIKDPIEFSKTFEYLDYSNYANTNFSSKEDNFCHPCYFPKNEIKRVTVGLSYACNLNCYHCFYENHRDTKELKELYFETLEKIKGHNLDIIEFTDRGEPFFYYYKIRDYLKTLTTEDAKTIKFLTNLNLLSEERIKELKDISEKTGIHYKFEASIDGITKEAYENTRINGKFDRVITNLKYLLNNFDDVLVNYTIKKPNMTATREEIETFFKNLGVWVVITYDFFDEDCKKLFIEKF